MVKREVQKGVDVVAFYSSLLGDCRIYGGEAVFFCPFDGCVGYKKPKFYVNTSSGAWCCKHCCQDVPGKTYRRDARERSGGTLNEFVSLWNVLHPESPADPSLFLSSSSSNYTTYVREEKDLSRCIPLWSYLFSISTLKDVHRAQIEDRGIDPVSAGMVSSSYQNWSKTLDTFGFDAMVYAGLIPPRSSYPRPSLCVSPNRILIPQWEGDSVASFVGYMKCPPKHPKESELDYLYMKEGWVSYPGPSGIPSQVFGSLQKGSQYAIITEGQLKALSALQRGFPCLGLPGMNSKHYEAALKCREAGVRNAIIILDEQPAEMNLIDATASGLAEILSEQGIRPYRGRLPLTHGITDKMDMDLFLKLNGAAALVDVLKDSLPYG